jgi:N-acetylglutamate synthase-like GNAT family acetyltransferase
MPVRKARPSDFARIRELAARDDLDYEDMEADRFWVAVEGGRVVGACGLAAHPDCLELRSLAVEEPSRGRGWGRRLVAAVLRAADRDVYLTTIRPGFFEAAGFGPASVVPPSMVKDEALCAGCRRDLCRVMVRER